MTNEEKAKSLWYRFCTEESCDGHVDCKLCPKAQVHHQLIEMAQWKDEQFNEEKKELLGLVNMLKIDETNQTIIEDLKAMLQ